MDKERRELSERMRIIAKRMDHVERAFRKAEIPLLVDDYARQQAEDRAAFEATSRGALDAAKQSHQERLDAKRRLGRIMADYRVFCDTSNKSRREDFSNRSQDAAVKIANECLARRTTILKQREQETHHKEEEERIRKQQEEERKRIEEGT